MKQAKVLALPTQRPTPPDEVLSITGRNFVPAPELEHWVRSTFLNAGKGLFNSDHAHLEHAHIGFLWAGIANNRQMRRIIGTAEDPNPVGMGAWKKGRIEQQLTEWFRAVPDFLITIDASFGEVATHREFCALVEHELYHCAQAVDEAGAPRFSKSTGKPIFAMRGHDVEEFYGVVARYGMTKDMELLVKHAEQQPKVPSRLIDGVCGTCRRAA